MPPDTRPALLAAAMAAAGRGWPVFPLRPGSKVPAGHPEHRCPGTGRCAGGHLKPEQRATTDLDLIRAAWTARPYNIGLATGPAGLVVIDLDRPKDGNSTKDTPCGVRTFRALCERAGQPVPTTRTVRTASGGRHLYFTAPPGATLRNTAGKLGPLIDTRAWGGYVVACGSTTGTGTYEVTGPAPVAALPAWLADALTADPACAHRAAPALGGGVPAYIRAAVDNEKHNVANAEEGQRNTALVHAARALGRFVAAGQLSRAEVEESLSWGAEAAGQKPYEYRSALTSALNWSIANNPGPVRR